MATPTITSERQWSWSDVRRACIMNELYIRGTNSEYEAMLDSIETLEPTPENIYRVAKDIYDHSRGQTITNIMFILEKEAVDTFYYIDGSDEI